MAPAPARPVVIQTMWRTGGTYLSFALREQNPVALFYEPLHEDYSLYSKADWDGFAGAGAEAVRGHPTKSFHYLTDFPFLANAGVAGHRRAFAYEGFVLRREDSAPELSSYLRGLVACAEGQGRRPLFKFCRAFLRQPWLEAQFDPVTLYLTRKPAGMIASYAGQGAGAYFYSGYLRILKLNRNAPAFAPLYDWLAHLAPTYAEADEATAGDRLCASFSAEILHDVFLFFWALALAAHAMPHILVVDVGAWGRDAQEACADAVRRHTGLALSLADARALDAQEPDILGFARPAVFAPLLEAALAIAAPEARADLPDVLRRQIEALRAG